MFAITAFFTLVKDTGAVNAGDPQTAGAPAAKQAVAPGGQYAEINGARIYYEVMGQGQPMVLIHGYPLSGDLFREQKQALSRNFQVVTLDLRGFGRSQAPDDEASISTYAQDVIALMDKLNIQQAVVCGHSMGGMATLEIYKQAPDRVRAMVLIDTAVSAPIANQNMWRGFGEQAKEKGVESIAPLLVPQMLTGKARMKNQQLVTHVENMIKQTSVNGAVGGGKALAAQPDYTSMLGSIRVPTLILVGVEDVVTPISFSKDMNQAITNSKLVMIEGGAHAAIIEEAQRANQAIMQWANQHALSQTTEAKRK
jgi:pimeloyl-ACP methyl ester carboxylesterase